MHNSRTSIRNERYVGQIKEFSGLHFGTISPTDIDCFLDFKNKLFIFVELKYGTSTLSLGQRLALERLCDSCESDNRKSCLIIARHNCEYSESINVAKSIVSDIRWNRKWYSWESENNIVREAIDRILQWCDIFT